jgi:hypothetical protein
MRVFCIFAVLLLVLNSASSQTLQQTQIVSESIALQIGRLTIANATLQAQLDDLRRQLAEAKAKCEAEKPDAK